MPKREILECCISVLGQCCGGSGDPHSQVGVGKSALCSRFLHPDVDTWAELGYDHSHWLSQTDFSEAEINGEHFLYFGAARRRYCPRGGAFSGDVKDLSVHVVEHTTFCNDVLSQPFPGAGNYARRASGDQVKSRTSDKVAYTARSALGDEEYCVAGSGRQAFPTRFCKAPFRKEGGVDGYVFVLDPTKSARERAKQWQLWQDCWEQIASDKRGQCVLVLSKCDELAIAQRAGLNKTMKVVEYFTGASATPSSSPFSRRREESRGRAAQFQDCAGRMAVSTNQHVVPVFFTSAEDAVSVDLPFLYLAHLSLKLAGRPRGGVEWPSALRTKAQREKKALLALHGFLTAHVKSRSRTWDDVATAAASSGSRQLQCCRTLHGLRVCKAAFKSHILALVFEDAEGMVKEHGDTSQAKRRAVHQQRQQQQQQQQQQDQASSRDGRIRSLAARLAREHPDLQEYVKYRTDSRSTDYEHLHFHSARLQAVARDIVQRPIESLPSSADATGEEAINAEIGDVAAPLMSAKTVSESTNIWKKVDERLMQSLDKLKSWAVESDDYQRLEMVTDELDLESEGNSVTSQSPLVAESKSACPVDDDVHNSRSAPDSFANRRMPSKPSGRPATSSASDGVRPTAEVPTLGAVRRSSEQIHRPVRDECRGRGHRKSFSTLPNAVARRPRAQSCASQANCLVVANRAARTSFISIDAFPSDSAC